MPSPAALTLVFGLLAGGDPAQATQPSLAGRLSELRAALQEIAGELDQLRSRTPPAAPNGRAPAARAPGLSPEKEVEVLEGLVSDLRASLKNLRSDLKFREAGSLLAKDLGARKPEYGRVKLPDAPPRSPSPLPPSPPIPAGPAQGNPPVPGDTPVAPPASVPAAAIHVERPVPQLPPEALAGADRVVLRVKGLDVRKGEIDDLVAYQRTYSSGPDGLLIRDALDRALLPVKIVLAQYKDKADALQAKAEKIRADLASGKDFAELAKANSDDRTTAPNGGDLGQFGREDFKLPFARVAFTTEKGKASAPFWTPFGLNLLRVDEVLKGEKPALDRVRARYILLAFDPRDPNFYQTLNRLADEAKVEVVDPSYTNAVPPRYLKPR
ncbi:MAG TPA: peptidylprolyl isomerase [Planctomycetota bacterium]|jgi:hypothetical protein|nr:peptidylprolyl isomerase [Planctomycetota bacterium]